MNINIASYVKTAKTVITANSPVLLLGATIAGVATTGVLAAKAGYRARGMVDEARMKQIASPEPPFDTFAEYYETYLSTQPELTLQEQVRLTWLCYAVPAVTGASTILSAVGIHTIHTKRAHAMSALYAVTSTKLDDYTTKAEELLGPKKTQELTNDTAQKQIDRSKFENSEVIMTDHGKELCYDELSGRYFYGSHAKIEDAANEVNRKLIDDGDCALNDWYDFIGLPPIPWGAAFGWQGPNKVNISTGATKAPDGRSAISVWFHDSPKDNYTCP